MSETVTPQDTSVENSPERSDSEHVLGVAGKRRRTSKIDPTLAEAKNVALDAIHELADPTAVGPVHHLRGEEERLTTHLFECTLPGYRGWFWFATLSRAPRSKVATVCEIGLLPGDDALLAPEWVPWAERMRDLDALAAFRREAEDFDDAAEEGLDDEADFSDAEDLEPEEVEVAQVSEELEDAVEQKNLAEN